MNIEELAKEKAAEWSEYQHARAFQANNPPVWSPRMTEQQKQEHERYIKEHDLPF